MTVPVFNSTTVAHIGDAVWGATDNHADLSRTDPGTTLTTTDRKAALEARQMADALGAPFHGSQTTRLLIDLIAAGALQIEQAREQIGNPAPPRRGNRCDRRWGQDQDVAHVNLRTTVTVDVPVLASSAAPITNTFKPPS